MEVKEFVVLDFQLEPMSEEVFLHNTTTQTSEHDNFYLHLERDPDKHFETIINMASAYEVVEKYFGIPVEEFVNRICVVKITSKKSLYTLKAPILKRSEYFPHLGIEEIRRKINNQIKSFFPEFC